MLDGRTPPVFQRLELAATADMARLAFGDSAPGTWRTSLVPAVTLRIEDLQLQVLARRCSTSSRRLPASPRPR